MSGPMQFTGGVLVPVAQPKDDATVAQQSDDDFMRKMFAQTPTAVLIQQPATAPAVVSKKPEPLSPKNVIKLAKQRLREVKTELRRMEALKKERGELERLIAAAEAKPAKATPSPTIVNIKR